MKDTASNHGNDDIKKSNSSHNTTKTYSNNTNIRPTDKTCNDSSIRNRSRNSNLCRGSCDLDKQESYMQVTDRDLSVHSGSRVYRFGFNPKP